MEEHSQYMDMLTRTTEMISTQSSGLPGVERIVADLKDMMQTASVLVKTAIIPKTDDENVRRDLNATLAVSDAELMGQIGNLIKGQVDSIEVNLGKFDPAVFIQNVLERLTTRTSVGQEPMLDWTRLNGHTDSCFKYAPSYDYILGTFKEPIVKVRKQRDAGERKVASQVKQPENVTTVEEGTGEAGIEESFGIVHGMLKTAYRRNAKRPIGYYSFVIDPNSFAKTVENIFHTSFLVKDGLVEIFYDENDLPLIRPMKRGSEGQKGESNQCIVSMDMSDWKTLKELYNIKTAMIKTPTHLDATLPSTSQ